MELVTNPPDVRAKDGPEIGALAHELQLIFPVLTMTEAITIAGRLYSRLMRDQRGTRVPARRADR